MASTTYKHFVDANKMYVTHKHLGDVTAMACDFVKANKIDHIAALGNMVRNAGQLPQPFWLGAACGGGSRSAAHCAART